jgi:hypothetical protein
VPLHYQSAEEIRKGDRVLYDGEPGEIEFVADRLTGDSELDWFVNEHGGGVMFVELELKALWTRISPQYAGRRRLGFRFDEPPTPHPAER